MNKKKDKNDKTGFIMGMLTGGAIATALVKLISIVEIFVIAASVMAVGQNASAGTYYIDDMGNQYRYEDGYYYDDDGNRYDQDEFNSLFYKSSSSDKTSTILGLIEKYFLYEYDEDYLMDYMYTGLVAGLEDPYAAYYTAEYVTASNQETNYCGIGAMVTFNAETYDKIITYVYLNSPAEKAGLQAGDIIISVDGVDMRLYDLDTTVDLIRGEEGTDVVVGYERDGQEYEVTITRAPIKADTVAYKMLTDSVGYIQLIQFTSSSLEEVQTALTELQSRGMESLVFDLRDNPGGLLTAVVDICDLFLDKGLEIVAEKDKNGEGDVYYSENAPVYTDPMVILVNGNSASASELMTGALKSHDRAAVIGTQTFGKGIVQNTIGLSDGSAIKFTVAYYYLPDGTCIHGVGITPDYIVEAGEDEEADPQLDKALELLQ